MQGVGGSSPPSSTTSHRSSSGGTAKRPFVLTTEGHVVVRSTADDPDPHRPEGGPRRASLDAASRSADRWTAAGAAVRRGAPGRALADRHARIGQRAVGGVLDQRADPRRRAPGPGGRGRRRRRGQRAGQRGPRGRHRAHRRPLDLHRRRLARHRHRLRAGGGRAALGGRRGLRKVALGVFPDNERAIAVYEKRASCGRACAGCSTAPATGSATRC